jgi:hypothetical protein
VTLAVPRTARQITDGVEDLRFFEKDVPGEHLLRASDLERL